MSNSDKLKKLRDAILAQGPGDDFRIVQEPTDPPLPAIYPVWTQTVLGVDETPASYLVSYAAEGKRWWAVLSPIKGIGLAHVLNCDMLVGPDVTHIRITRLERNPEHKWK